MRSLAVSALVVILAACSPQATPPADEAAPPAAGPGWTYADQTAWGDACASGQAQSPIDLADLKDATDLADLASAYPAGAGTLIDTGRTLELKPAGGALTIGDEALSLLQFHFHAPSEHTLAGQSFPAELHFVHRDAAGGLAVLGVFIEEGAENPALASLLANLPGGEGEAAGAAVTIDPAPLLPEERAYYAYSGSLTTPPCSEGVRWHVLKQPIAAAPEQINALRAALGESNRAIQPLNAREVAFGE